MLKIWEKYFIRLFLSTLCFVLFGFYTLYVLIDYSCHTSYVHSGIDSPLLHLSTIYLSELANRLDVLLPFATLIATIKTLTQLNTQNELVALLAGGISLRRLLRPLVIIGLCLTAILYANTQFVLPRAKNTLKAITEEQKAYKKKRGERPFVQHVALEDDTKVIFQKYDSVNQRFQDAYWVIDSDNLYHMQYLYPYKAPPKAEGVQHFSKNAQGVLRRDSTLEEVSFLSMHFNKKRLWETTMLPDELSLTQMSERIRSYLIAANDKQATLLTTFYYKLLTPWLCLLAIIGPAPFCVRYSRGVPVFLIYAIFTFLFIAFHLILESAEVLGKRQVGDPLLVLLIPFAVFTLPAIWIYCRDMHIFRRRLCRT